MKQYDWIAGVACDKVSTNRNTIVQCYHRMNEWSKNPKQKETTAYLACLYMRVRHSYLCIGLFQYIVSLRIEWNGMNGNSKLIHLLARSLSVRLCFAVLCAVSCRARAFPYHSIFGELGCVSVHNSLEFSFIHSSPAYSFDCLCRCRCMCAPLVVYTHALYALFYTIGQIKCNRALFGTTYCCMFLRNVPFPCAKT